MAGKRDLEGYFMQDHRNAGAPIPDEIALAAGLPLGAGRGLFEAPTFTCSHCNRVVLVNPRRSEPLCWCSGCDHYLCHRCNAVWVATRICKPFKAFLAELQEAVARGHGVSSIVNPYITSR